MNYKVFLALILVVIAAGTLRSQNASFTYNGNLTNNGVPANGNHDFVFSLYDALSGGNQVGPSQTSLNVPVTNGFFSKQIDLNEFPGADRFLEVQVRPAGGGVFVTLNPRQLITSAPYSIKSIAADSAVNAEQLGSIAANQYTITTDPRLTDARNPLPGSANYVQNTAVQQVGSNFNISGTGTASIFNAATQYNLTGSRILSNAGVNNLFAGVSAGAVNTSGVANAFFGTFAGQGNTTGGTNSFFGSSAGFSNTTGSENAYFGTSAGSQNTTGNFNTFAGSFAGFANINGSQNAFFGRNAGSNNTNGVNNSFFGTSSGLANTTGNNNTLIGHATNFELGNLTFATAIGAGASVGSNNTIVLGRSGGQDLVHIPGNALLSGTLTTQELSAPIITATTQFNIGFARILANPGSGNLFAGVAAGTNTTGVNNAYFGFGTGNLSTTASGNSFFGSRAGQNQTGGSNSFFGERAGQNAHGDNNAFFGAASGINNFDGENNSFLGSQAGRNNQSGSNNVFIGTDAGISNVVGSFSSVFGASANLSNGLTNAAAIGSRAFVTQSNSISLGSINGTNGATADTNVGIGTTAPERKLHVRGPGSVEIQIESSDVGGRKWTLQSSAGASDGRFEIVDRTANASRLTILDNGNLGVGTTAPAVKVQVNDNAGSMLVGGAGCPSGSVSIGLNGAFGNCLNFTLRGSGDDVLINRPTGGDILFREGNNTTSQMRLRAGGVLNLVNLGTAGGTALCRNASNDIAACSSSVRYKNNVNTFRAGLSLVDRLRPVTFNWKEGGMADMGLVAEEVAEIEPLLVTHNDKGQVEGVKYDRIGVVLLNAVKEQQKQIDSQKKEINSQKTVIEGQRRELDAMKAYICEQAPSAAFCSVNAK